MRDQPAPLPDKERARKRKKKGEFHTEIYLISSLQSLLDYRALSNVYSRKVSFRSHLRRILFHALLHEVRLQSTEFAFRAFKKEREVFFF